MSQVPVFYIDGELLGSAIIENDMDMGKIRLKIVDPIVVNYIKSSPDCISIDLLLREHEAEESPSESPVTTVSALHVRRDEAKK